MGKMGQDKNILLEMWGVEFAEVVFLFYKRLKLHYFTVNKYDDKIGGE